MIHSGWRAVKIHCETHGVQNLLQEIAESVWKAFQFEPLPQDDELLVVEFSFKTKYIKKSEIFRYRAEMDEAHKNGLI